MPETVPRRLGRRPRRQRRPRERRDRRSPRGASLWDRIRERGDLHDRAAERLAAELAEVLPESLRYSYFLCSGSEAVEASAKLARQYWRERGRPDKWKVVSRYPSYHGNTLTALSLSGREHYRAAYGPLLTDFPRVPAPDLYRHPGCDACNGDAVIREIELSDPRTVAAFIAEPVIGSSLGAMSPPRDGYRRIKEAVRSVRRPVHRRRGDGRYGSNRTLVLVRALRLRAGHRDVGEGDQQRLRSAERSRREPWYRRHHRDWLGCVHARANVLALSRHLRCGSRDASDPQTGPAPRASRRDGAAFFGALDRLREHASVGDVRGRGLFAGIELVADRDSKRPFARSERIAERVAEAALERGLVIWTNVGHLESGDGDILMLGPPFIVRRGRVERTGRSARRRVAGRDRDVTTAEQRGG